MLSEAWALASIEYDSGSVRTGFTLLALLTNEELSRLLSDTTRELQRVEGEGLRKRLLCHRGELARGAGGAEAKRRSGRRDDEGRPGCGLGQDAAPGSVHGEPDREREGGQDRSGAWPRCGSPADDRHPDAPAAEQPDPDGRGGRGQDRSGGRARESVVQGDVPPALQGVHLHSLDLALLQAGASVKGEFENRLKGLINEIKSSTEKIILFIDEAHTMIGAGGTGGAKRCGEPLEAGAGSRRAADHRGDDLVGVQEVFREGPGTGATVPGREGGGAKRRGLLHDAAGHCGVAGKAPQPADSG